MQKGGVPLRSALIVLIVYGLFGFSSLAYAFCFDEAGAMYGVSPELLKDIATVESNLRPDAIHWNDGHSGSFSVGMMQVNSYWYPKIGHDLWMQLGDPCTNVKVGAWILAGCIQQYGYNWKAVGCYNAKTPYKMAAYAQKVYKVLQKSLVNESGGN
jgi:soluble lytic murein transglycosylase-like protein